MVVLTAHASPNAAQAHARPDTQRFACPENATYREFNYGVLGRVGTMAGWYMARRPNMSSKAVIALALLAFALVAAVPVALLVGVILMLLGHVIGGLALFGGSILAATAAVVLASVTGVRHLRGVVRGMLTEHDLTEHNFAEHDSTEHNSQVFQLDRDDYTYIR
jgi:hypothetical protein